MTDYEPQTVGDYTEVECENDNCDRWPTVHVDDRDSEVYCAACGDGLDAEEANATFPRVGDL